MYGSLCVRECVNACLCLRVYVWPCAFRWPLGTPWGIKQDFPSLGVLGRMVGWWLQSFLKLSTLSRTWDLTWDWTSAWQICPDQWETSECLIMVSIERFSFCSFPSSFCSDAFSVSVWWKGKVGDGGFILSPTKTCIVALCLHFSPYKTPPSLGGVTSRNIKGRLFFSKLMTPRFPIYLSGPDWDGNEGLIDGDGCFRESRVSVILTALCMCVCVRARECVCVWEERSGCVRQGKTSSKTRCFCSHHRQTGFSSTLDIICIKMWNCPFFLRKSNKNVYWKKNIFMYFHKIAFK